MIVSRSTIHKQKRKIFHLSSILSYLPPFFLIFSNIMPIYLKSSDGRCRKGIRRSNGSRPA